MYVITIIHLCHDNVNILYSYNLLLIYPKFYKNMRITKNKKN